MRGFLIYTNQETASLIFLKDVLYICSWQVKKWVSKIPEVKSGCLVILIDSIANRERVSVLHFTPGLAPYSTLARFVLTTLAANSPIPH